MHNRLDVVVWGRVAERRDHASAEIEMEKVPYVFCAEPYRTVIASAEFTYEVIPELDVVEDNTSRSKYISG